MARIIPNPVRLACTDCHRDMRVQFQTFEPATDSLIVAAECDCGRVMGEIDGHLLQAGFGTPARPFHGSSMQHIPELGHGAKERIIAMRGRIDELERLIAAATWASERLRKAP